MELKLLLHSCQLAILRFFGMLLGNNLISNDNEALATILPIIFLLLRTQWPDTNGHMDVFCAHVQFENMMVGLGTWEGLLCYPSLS